MFKFAFNFSAKTLKKYAFMLATLTVARQCNKHGDFNLFIQNLRLNVLKNK